MLLEQPGGSANFDKGEISKLPPLNDFIRKNMVESLDDVQCKDIEAGVWHTACLLRRKEQATEDLQTTAKQIALKKKKELAEAKEVKDKKPGGKEPAAAIRGEVIEEGKDSKAPFVENRRIEVGDSMAAMNETPECHPRVAPSDKVHFIQGQALIEHDDYFDLLKQAKHQLMQDDMAVANKTEPTVVNKLIRPPKKFSFTSV